MAHLSKLAALLALTLPGAALAQAGNDALTLLAAGSCEPALAKLSGLKGPDPETGRKLAEGIAPCRKDRIVAFALTEKALELAPGDAAVLLAHVESLSSVEQFKEAGALLEKLSAKDAATPAARIARAEVAAGLGDGAAAQRHAKGLEGDPRYGARARKVLAEAKAAQGKQSAEAASAKQAELLNRQADKLRKLQPPAEGGEESTGEHGGEGGEAISGGRSIRNGEETSFVATGVRKGKPYAFEATGGCTRYRSMRGRRYHQSDSIFGVDFRVQIGDEAPIPFAVGDQGEDRVRVNFVAKSDNPTVRVIDRSSVEADVSCNLRGFTVVPR